MRKEKVGIGASIRRCKREYRRVGLAAFLSISRREKLPEGLTIETVKGWIDGTIKQARQDHIDCVLNLWASLPDDNERTFADGTVMTPRASGSHLPGNEWIYITPDFSRHLKSELARVGADPARLLAGRDDKPADLSPRIIHGLLYGHARTAHAGQWEYVRNLLLSLEDGALRQERKSPAPYPPRNPRIPEADLLALRQHRARTGIGGNSLLNGASDKPAGLSGPMVSTWLSGRTTTAIPEHVSYVLARYAAQPDK